jgi:hypothetical protein
MGYIAGKAPEPLAYERWLLGWLDENQIVCQQTGDETTTVSAIEEQGGVKAVMVPISPTSAVVVESRRALVPKKLKACTKNKEIKAEQSMQTPVVE